MAETKNHPAGSFCWVELGTSDQDAAKKFYSSLFGWTVTDNPMGPDGVYTIFKLKGRDAAAGYTLRKEELDQHVPPHWNLYITVDSADAAVAKAAKVGGTVLAPAFDVMDAGRMGVIQDPTGAAFCLWQAKKSAGIEAENENGALCWADLSTPDPQRAGKFYSDLFGWKLEKGENDPSGYLHIKNGETHIGGIPPAEYRDPKSPAHWLIYFMVESVEAATEKAKGMGAKVYMPPRKMEGVGTWSVVADPQGAVFALFKSSR
jgi:predicted enzyme related to lactoylglutathione lyase